MQISKRTMNWLPRASVYDQAVAAREKRREQSQAFLARSDAVASALIGGGTANSTEKVNLAIQVAVDRLQNRTTKKV